jgi:hypothetical protein
MKRHMQAYCTVLTVAVMFLRFLGGAASAQSLVQDPAAQSPHWSHINLYDFGRAMIYVNEPDRTISNDWFAQHLDAAEVHGNTSELTTRNPTLKTTVYKLDLTTFINTETASLPEAYFLHFSEDTQLRFTNQDGSENATISIPGCPEGTPAALACRVQGYIWSSRRYIHNLADPTFRPWKAQDLLTTIGSRANGVFLDEHGPGFIIPNSWGNQVKVLSGGGIREFHGQRAISTGDTVDTAYNDVMVEWLTYLAAHFKQADKYVIVNPASYSTYPAVLAQIKAANGVSTEFMHRPDGWAGAYQYQQFQDMVKSVVNAGGVVDLAGIWCYGGPNGYTSGNYESTVARYHMWQLASYYLMKEPVGSEARVYYDTGFCSNATVKPLTNPTEWLLAYQADIGQPVSDAVVFQEGTAGQGSGGRACAYKIWSRTYTKSTVYVRPKDMWDCVDYGDTSAAMVTLATPGQLVKEDGTLKPAVSSVSLRNGEGVIVYNGNTTSPGSISINPPPEKPSMQKPSQQGLLSKLKSLMQRVK